MPDIHKMMNQRQYQYFDTEWLWNWYLGQQNVRISSYSIAYKNDGMKRWFNTSKRSCRFFSFAKDLSKVKE